MPSNTDRRTLLEYFLGEQLVLNERAAMFEAQGPGPRAQGPVLVLVGTGSWAPP